MKKNLIYFTILSFVICFYSCKKNELDSLNQEKVITYNNEYYAYYGNLHNEGLEHILNELNNSKVGKSNSYSNKQLQSFIIKSSINFIKCKETVNLLMEKQIEDIYNKTLTYRAQDSYLSATRVKSEKVKIEDRNRKEYYRQFGAINDRQLEYIKKMEVVYECNKSVSQKIKTLMDIKNELIGGLSKTEAHPLLCGIYTAISSLSYWQNNGYKWQIVLLEIKEIDASEFNINILRSATKNKPIGLKHLKNSSNKTLRSPTEGDPINLEQYSDLPDGIYPWPGTVKYAISVKDHHCHILVAPKGLFFDPTLGLFVPMGSSDFKWSDVSKADWEGAISGAIGGAIGGAPGALAGGMAASIGSSAAAAINQLFY